MDSPLLSLEFLPIILVVAVIILIFKGVKRVPQGLEYTVERFGRYTRTLKPGIQFIWPFIDKVGSRVNMMEQVADVPQQEVITKDNAMVSADGVVFFKVMDAAKSAYRVNDMYRAILNITMTNIRSVMGSMDLDELLSQRDVINSRLLTVVDEAAATWGIKVTRIEIKDINPPMDLVESMGRQMKAEREKRALILEAEGTRAAQILNAEGIKQAAILAAEGEKESSFREAEARERLAEAEARATAMVSKAIGDGDVQAINYFVAQKYTEALQQIGSANNSKIVMMPMEAASLMGSIAGIAEITKETFGANDDKGGVQ